MGPPLPLPVDCTPLPVACTEYLPPLFEGVTYCFSAVIILRIYSTLSFIPGNAILSPRDPSPQGPNGVLNCSLNNSLNSSLSRASSFTMLDPASGVPCSDGTPRTLAASLTSRASMHHGGGYQAFLPSGLGRYGHSAIRQVISKLIQVAAFLDFLDANAMDQRILLTKTHVLQN